MRVRTRPGRQRTSWRRSLGLSVALHALALGALGIGVGARAPAWGEAISQTRWTLGWVAAEAEMSAAIDLTVVDPVSPMEPIPDVPVVSREPPVVVAAAVVGDQANAAPEAAPHLDDGAPTHRAPAPDRGAGAGRPLPDRAWRADGSTLHQRLTDGAEINQPSHALTGRLSASPQAVRREPITGEGDAARSAHHIPAATAAQYGVVDPTLPGAGGETLPGTDATAIALAPSLSPPVNQPERAEATSAQGPVDSDRGTRSYDVEQRGAMAADDHAARASSNEPHPSITDLTLAAVSGNTREGHGPSDTSGATARIAKGTAPAPPVVRSTSDGLSDGARTRERLYNRYVQEIGSRVNQALIWPRALAIRLEQGETVVRFVVLPDGRLGDNVRVVKSSGFAEFDQAALDAIHKAAPFPPMRETHGARALSVSLPVNFSNPVIR